MELISYCLDGGNVPGGARGARAGRPQPLLDWLRRLQTTGWKIRTTKDALGLARSAEHTDNFSNWVIFRLLSRYSLRKSEAPEALWSFVEL